MSKPNINLNYKEQDGVILPDLQISNSSEADRPLGRYGRMALEYLKDNQPERYTILKMDGSLMEVMHRVQDEATEKIEALTQQMLQQEPAPQTEDMPLAATRAPYTLFIVDDDMPLTPREDYDCLGKMVCWHGRYSLGEKHDFEEPRDFLKDLLFSEYSSSHNRSNPVFAFLKSGKAKDAKLEYNRSTREWELLENQRWTSESEWYVSSSYAASLKDDVPDWFLDDCLSALSTGELFSLVEQIEGMVILPLYLYDHSGTISKPGPLS